MTIDIRHLSIKARVMDHAPTRSVDDPASHDDDEDREERSDPPPAEWHADLRRRLHGLLELQRER